MGFMLEPTKGKPSISSTGTRLTWTVLAVDQLKPASASNFSLFCLAKKNVDFEVDSHFEIPRFFRLSAQFLGPFHTLTWLFQIECIGTGRMIRIRHHQCPANKIEPTRNDCGSADSQIRIMMMSKTKYGNGMNAGCWAHASSRHESTDVLGAG